MAEDHLSDIAHTMTD
jgi:hypothetical protein